MEEKKIKLGKEKISELGGELGDFMINNINRLHPPYAQFIKNSVAAMNSDSLLNQREREIIRLSSLITVGASLVQVKNTIRMMLKRNIFSKNEIGEIIMQTSFFCGFSPAITAAFVALEVIDELDK
ncbi:Carboxymuconolactone decarboxylase family protein [Candidatus Megaera venefica]|uniref:Carboxymuconolactone decarboxylase family protein n=1 Tax=Candidatus Megaera venefica TaxID=2055910 RepID=A0ABU5NCK6_9RICK|nr:carboxymuconolactone decarboxylase family protein [Candidatus Megaera venefica]MEA0970908.1 Carboxymuconolactone decarboxylase family protein [Candidatus Megaera venefica]